MRESEGTKEILVVHTRSACKEVGIRVFAVHDLAEREFPIGLKIMTDIHSCTKIEPAYYSFLVPGQ